MPTTIDNQISFLKEIDKLKNIVRKSPLTDRSRRENSAEHSWHLAMYALILSDHSDRAINIDRVIRMLSIHDIVEIDAGDHPIHDALDPDNLATLERDAADRIFGLFLSLKRKICEIYGLSLKRVSQVTQYLRRLLIGCSLWYTTLLPAAAPGTRRL